MKSIFFIFFICSLFAQPKVQLGVDLFFQEGGVNQLKGKRVGLITNQTGMNKDLISTIELLKYYEKDYELVALFAPEHGIHGAIAAAESFEDSKSHGLTVYSLHGNTRRPTDKMLANIDVLIYDIQDIGCRTYTYATTLYYAMEEAARKKIQVIVFDRPNPINGLIVDGPMLADKWRSFIGYINVPYCHGMTIGELARFFNAEYKVGCDLTVIPMKGWKRTMSFKDTGLNWIPTSPFVPEPDTPLFYATTGILGELNFVNIGGGCNLPFKIVGASWIDGELLAKKLNNQKLPGVHFIPYYYRPMFGAYKGLECQGAMILVTDWLSFRPLSVQYLILGMLKTLYPKQVSEHLAKIEPMRRDLFCKANGCEEVLRVLEHERYVAWKLIDFQRDLRKAFLVTRSKYLLY